MKNIDLVNLGSELESILEEYRFNSKTEINEVTLENAVILKDKVKQLAPVLDGKYKKSIKFTKGTSILGSDYYIIHASGIQYVKSHLLEKSHALATGGRTRAFPHFAPAVNAVEDKYIRELMNALKGD